MTDQIDFDKSRLISEAAGWVRASTYICTWAEDRLQTGRIGTREAQAIMDASDALKDIAVSLRKQADATERKPAK